MAGGLKPVRLFVFIMEISVMASAILSDLKSGLAGMNSNPNISIDQIEDEIIEVRQSIIREMYTKGILQKHDLMLAINCIEVDCKDPAKCCNAPSGKSVLHFEIPQLVDSMGLDAIDFIGSADRGNNLKKNVYFSSKTANYHKYKRFGATDPYIYIEKTPNENKMYDCWIYNIPFVKKISIIGIFKDPRQLEWFECCNSDDANYRDLGSISDMIKEKITKSKFYYYRQAIEIPVPNKQIPR